ncbi:hypothetical protein ZEAMMB73_Zm00001d049023 [Zea mays]|uniref:RST domain-containing protein n=1 Tax=Zea mays TaxID=4577 RepID=A0A1D6PRN9_MAIZE|nr:hypothetical protein ZEAMMB73_Zm00001d049023 [Zea mays]AQK49404.1 hypothetical protein ZEAMMB73_Zm00001d049023 [Zea mays]AQK49415.1 hypothetical protein ZEAMMB73_Zm00001d049023 [Zea mays]
MRKNEVSKEYFLKTVRNIVGDKLLKQAASRYQMQAQRSPQTNPSNYSLSGQVSGQQTAPSGSVTGDEQKGYPWAHTIPMRQAIASTRPICIRLMKWETFGGPAAPFRPQMADSNPRAHLIRGAVTTVSGSVPTRSIVSGNAPGEETTIIREFACNRSKGKVGMTGDWLEHLTFAVYLLPFFLLQLNLVLMFAYRETVLEEAHRGMELREHCRHIVDNDDRHYRFHSLCVHQGSSSSTTGAIVGGVAAGAALLFAVPAISFAYWRHRKPQEHFFNVSGFKVSL